jgi:hypothetical protein
MTISSLFIPAFNFFLYVSGQEEKMPACGGGELGLEGFLFFSYSGRTEYEYEEGSSLFGTMFENTRARLVACIRFSFSL